jgi:hypothetical protein
MPRRNWDRLRERDTMRRRGTDSVQGSSSPPLFMPRRKPTTVQSKAELRAWGEAMVAEHRERQRKQLAQRIAAEHNAKLKASSGEHPDYPEYDGDKDFGKSIEEAYRLIRERKAKGGPGWTPKEKADDSN